MSTKSPARLQVIDFLKATKGKINVEYEFTCDGNFTLADVFVKRMRTELTRLRNLLREGGKEPAYFKVILVSIVEEQKSPAKCRVKLRKTDGGMSELDEVLDEETIDALMEAGREQ